MCISAGLPDFCANLHGILLRSPNFRAQMLAATQGVGSWFGLITSVAMMTLPILAHHNIIRGKMLQQAMYQAPFMLLKLQKKLEEGTENLTEMLADAVNGQKAAANGKPN
jgi:hypothetical protein